MMQYGRVFGVCLCFATGASGQYVGAQVCGSCHPERLKQQSATEHARALRPVTEHSLAQRFLSRDRKGAVGIHYEFTSTPAGLGVRITTRKDQRVIPIQWAFGAGDQAVTFVSQLDEDSYIEHRLSFYTRAGALDLTPGHPATVKTVYPDVAGVVYKTFGPEANIMRCFQCHSTGRLSLGEHMQLVPAELGVRCEACHGPGKKHVDAISAGDIASARKRIQNPGRMPPGALNEFCGDCHRKPQQGETATNWNDPWNTRHQPLYLAQSACFRQSKGALTCLTCHDAHGPLRRNAADFYNGKCSGCHGAKLHPAVAGTANPNDCISCHMPGVWPRAYLRFANHWIGVYREESPLKPIRKQQSNSGEKSF